MSGAPDPMELSADEALAAEHALGVLGARERAEAEARIAREPAFAAEVEAWRSRLAPLLDSVEATPVRETLWDGIARRLPANDDSAELGKRLRFWRTSAMGGFGLAAASLAAVVMLAAQPPRIVERMVPPTGALLNASLMSQGDRVQPLFVAAYDPDRRALIVTSLVQPGTDPVHVHQLWLLAGKDPPKSLGFIEPGRSKMIPMPGAVSGKVAEGVALAVSVEAPGGSSNPDGPTGPIAAVGKLSRL